MNYTVRPGIVPVSVCGANLLVPTRAASEACPNIATLSMIELMFWKKISLGEDTEKLYQLYASLSFHTVEDVRPKVDSMLQRLFEHGFLLKQEDEQ